MEEVLRVHPHCLMFFVDETGHESFADPNYPVFGLGGCAIMAGAIAAYLRTPWRALKEEYFGGADVRLHASDMRTASQAQLSAIGEFFRRQEFGRFAVTMTGGTQLPANRIAYEIMPGAIRKRCAELASRCQPTLIEVAFIHEESKRGDRFVKRYFGPTFVKVNGQTVKVHQGFMSKARGDEAMEVADFIVNAAGRRALSWSLGDMRPRRDFDAVFGANPLWQSFFHVQQAAVQAA
ncbi:MAG: DUF3800 domain-containing protein [Proteobacteria bacterium]|nr:DUF3800 domain-containing protein [Pseudomonadota bacterium]MBI3497964.1 DUF3800 domain-containing protein [Pseudomonadota bacterium]